MAGDFQAGSAWIPVRPDFKGFHKEIGKEFGKVGPQAAKSGQDSGARFADGFRARLRQALAKLPEARIDADSSPAERKLAELRSRMESLAGKTIGVDVDGGAAAAELRDIQSQMAALGDGAIRIDADTASAQAHLRALAAEAVHVGESTPVVRVEADTASANTQLAATNAQVERLDRTVQVRVDTSGALAGLGMLSIAAAGVATIPVGATLAAGLTSMIGPLAAAGAGFGALALVAVPAITDISDALKLQEQAAAGSEAAAEKYAAALAEMSPAARTLMGDWQGLTTEFRGWSRSLEEPVLGVFSQGIGVLSGRFDSLTPLVVRSAGAVSGLLDDLDAALGSAFWTQFGTRLTALAPSAITSLGGIGGNIATGLAGVINAFLPYAPAMLDYVERITAGFANWGTGLDGSDGLRSFMGYVAEVGPQVGEFFSALSGAALNLITSLAPLGPIALGGFGALLQVIAQLPPPLIQTLALAITSVVLATKAWGIASMFMGRAASIMAGGIKGIGMSLKTAFMANPIGVIITALTALIPLVLWAWNNVSWFRDGILTAWTAIKDASIQLWQIHLKPMFDQLVMVIQTYVVPAIMWLWHNVIIPAFAGIAMAVSLYWNYYVKPVFTALAWVIMNVIVPVVMFLWHNVVVPAFTAIGAVIAFVWNTLIKPQLMAWWAFITVVLIPVLTWLWKNVVAPVFRGIGAAISAAWNGVIKPVFAWLRAGITAYVVTPFLVMRVRVASAWSLMRSALAAGWAWIRDNVFARVRSGVDAVKDAFGRAATGIKSVWARIKGYTKDPINFVITTVYTNGIRALAGKVLSAVGVKKNPLPTFSPIATGGIWQGPGRVQRYNDGGVLPGYTPGRDPHRFYSATGGALELSGGEAILRPEVTRVLGPSMIHEVNALARNGGVSALKRRFGQSQGFATGGIYQPTQSFARGGILSAASLGWDWVTDKADEISGAAKKWFLDKLGLESLLGAVPDGGFMTTFAKGLFKNLLVPKIGNLINKKDEAYGGSSDAVVKVAMKYAKNPGSVGGDYNNKFQRAFGMPGQPWCFPAGTLVRTPNGHRPIEEVTPGTPVVTPSGAVVETSALLQREKPLLAVTVFGTAPMESTADHPFWARRGKYATPEWVKAGELVRGDMVAIPLVEGEGCPVDADVAYFLGVYAADGHRLHRDRGVQISDSPDQVERLVSAVKAAGFDNPHVSQGRTAAAVTVYDEAAYKLCAQAGDLAHGKRVPGLILNADRESREAFLQGYLAGDGHLDNRGVWQCSTVSRELAVSLAELLRSLGHVPGVRVVREAGEMVIEGRTVHTRRAYAVTFQPEASHARASWYVEDGVLWVPVRSVVETGRTETVYDITVPGEHAFIADGVWVHNCAMFVSEVIREARAQKKYNNIRHAHSRAFRDGLPKGSASNAKPGWIATYGGEPRHINIIAYRKGGQNYTIGGNESNAVRGPRVYGAATNIMKPKYAAGGVLDKRVLKQDYRDNRERTTPIQTQFLRSAVGLPAFSSGGWIRGASGDRNLILGADGEFVVNESAARDNAGLLEALNSGHQLRDILSAAGPVGLSASQQRALSTLSGGQSGSSTVNAELHLHNGEATVRQAFRELRYEVRRTELSGKYGRG